MSLLTLQRIKTVNTCSETQRRTKNKTSRYYPRYFSVFLDKQNLGYCKNMERKFGEDEWGVSHFGKKKMGTF